jgi:hypothetical protein
MKWLHARYRRCVDLLLGWFGSVELLVRPGNLANSAVEIASCDPVPRIATRMRIRQETPPGIAKLATILGECAGESEIPAVG